MCQACTHLCLHIKSEEYFLEWHIFSPHAMIALELLVIDVPLLRREWLIIGTTTWKYILCYLLILLGYCIIILSMHLSDWRE